jgi:hypothetical protein
VGFNFILRSLSAATIKTEFVQFLNFSLCVTYWQQNMLSVLLHFLSRAGPVLLSERCISCVLLRCCERNSGNLGNDVGLYY